MTTIRMDTVLKIQKIASVGKDAEKLELLCIAGGKAKAVQALWKPV